MTVEDCINVWHELLVKYMFVLNIKTKVNQLLGMLFVAMNTAFSDFGEQSHFQLLELL